MLQTNLKNMKTTTNSFFSKAENTKPFFKANFFGFAGTGKTYTAALLALGIHQKIKSTKPIVIFDTEKASKFLLPIFEPAGISLEVKESRSLADLKETMRIMREGYSDILIIDSISHIWENFLEAYRRQKNRSMLQFQDWGVIKPTFKTEFSDPFVNDPYHIIMCGRAGYEYDNEINQETGKREIFKSGVKEKVEGETAYEPDMLVLMERYQEMENGTLKKAIRQATILKDRSNILDGKVFENPTFADFEPSIDVMLHNPVRKVSEAERDAATLIKSEEEKKEWIKEKTVALEELENYLVSIWPGRGAEETKNKVDALFYAFGTRSWTAITQLSPQKIKDGTEKVKEIAQKYIKELKTKK